MLPRPAVLTAAQMADHRTQAAVAELPTSVLVVLLKPTVYSLPVAAVAADVAAANRRLLLSAVQAAAAEAALQVPTARMHPLQVVLQVAEEAATSVTYRVLPVLPVSVAADSSVHRVELQLPEQVHRVAQASRAAASASEVFPQVAVVAVASSAAAAAAADRPEPAAAQATIKVLAAAAAADHHTLVVCSMVLQTLASGSETVWLPSAGQNRFPRLTPLLQVLLQSA